MVRDVSEFGRQAGCVAAGLNDDLKRDLFIFENDEITWGEGASVEGEGGCAGDGEGTYGLGPGIVLRAVFD